MVAPSKTKEAQHDVTFAEGGDGHMFGKQSAGPDKPGNTGKDTGAAPGPEVCSGRVRQDVRLQPVATQGARQDRSTLMARL